MRSHIWLSPLMPGQYGYPLEKLTFHRHVRENSSNTIFGNECSIGSDPSQTGFSEIYNRPPITKLMTAF